MISDCRVWSEGAKDGDECVKENRKRTEYVTIITIIIIISFLSVCRNFDLGYLAVAMLINYFAFLLSDCLKIWSSLPSHLSVMKCPSFGSLRRRNSYLPTAKRINKILL